MSIITPIPRTLPWYARLFFGIPVLGWMARDVTYGTSDNLWYALVILFTVLFLAIARWGIVALYLPVLATVPVCLFLLVWVSRG